jgi:hypothetical protein
METVSIAVASQQPLVTNTKAQLYIYIYIYIYLFIYLCIYNNKCYPQNR